MKKSCAIIGALFLVLLVTGIGLLVMKAPQWWEKGKKLVFATIAEEQRISTFEAEWTAPSAKPDAKWAPATIGSWRLKEVSGVTGWPELNVTRAGQRMIYENGPQTCEIGVVAANDLEKEVLVKRILDATKDAGNKPTTVGSGPVTVSTGTSQTTTTMGNRSHVRSGNHHTRVWWLKDWLFFFRARDIDPDIGEEYLRAISAQPAVAEPGAPAEAEPK